MYTRHPLRPVLAVLLAYGLLALLCVSAFIALRQHAEHSHRAEVRLLRFESLIHELGAQRWEAMAERSPAEARRGIMPTRRQALAALDSLAPLEPQDASAIRDAFARYWDALNAEMALVAAGRPAEAEALEAARLGPAQQALLSLVDASQARYERAQLQQSYTADAGALLTVLAAAMAISAVYWRFNRLRARQQARFGSMIQHLTDLLVVIDAEETIGFVSVSSERLIGRRPEDLVGARFEELVHPEDRGAMRKLLADGFSGDGTDGTIGLRIGLDGCWRTFEGRGVNRLADPKVASVVVTFRDITERRRVEGELKAAVNELQQLHVVKDEFLATVSHELRTPLTAIRNAGTILQKQRAGPLNPDQARFVALIQQHARRLNALVDDILDLQKLEHGGLHPRIEPRDLNGDIRAVAAGFAHVMEARKLRLELELAPDALVVPFDEALVGQVLMNLLSNAAKFTPVGGTVWVRSWQQAGEACVSVADSGIGVAANDLERIFRKFTQVSDSLSRTSGGTGLGLAICKKVIEETHGGRIWAEGRQEGGTAFTFTLPSGS